MPLDSTNIRQTMTDLIQRPRRLRKSPALRAMFEETTLSLNDLVLPIFVEEEIDDYKAVEAMPGVMRIPEKHLAREIERIANAGIRSVMTFGISHHTDETGSDAWREDGLVARMSRICKQTVPEMIVMSDTCFCEYTSHGHCGVLCEHGVDNDATLENLGKQAVVAAAAGADFIAPSAAMDGQVQAIRQALDAAGFKDTAIMSRLTGYAINPARDLGPRLAHAVLPIKGKGDSNFGYGLVVPIIGPIIGAIAAVLLYGAIPW